MKEKKIYRDRKGGMGSGVIRDIVTDKYSHKNEKNFF